LIFTGLGNESYSILWVRIPARSELKFSEWLASSSLMVVWDNKDLIASGLDSIKSPIGAMQLLNCFYFFILLFDVAASVIAVGGSRLKWILKQTWLSCRAACDGRGAFVAVMHDELGWKTR
jgi:hypothetical protein